MDSVGEMEVSEKIFVKGKLSLGKGILLVLAFVSVFFVMPVIVLALLDPETTEMPVEVLATFIALMGVLLIIFGILGIVAVTLLAIKRLVIFLLQGRYGQKLIMWNEKRIAKLEEGRVAIAGIRLSNSQKRVEVERLETLEQEAAEAEQRIAEANEKIAEAEQKEGEMKEALQRTANADNVISEADRRVAEAEQRRPERIEALLSIREAEKKIAEAARMEIDQIDAMKRITEAKRRIAEAGRLESERMKAEQRIKMAEIDIAELQKIELARKAEIESLSKKSSASLDQLIHYEYKKPAEDPIFIYALHDDDYVFYIGQTINPERRLKEHINNAHKFKTHKDAYIVAMQNRGLRPQMKIIAEAYTQFSADSIEQELIEEFGLTNMKHKNANFSRS